MFKRILVPTDVSEFSRQALLTALQLAKQFNSEVELFHVVFDPQPLISYATTYPISISSEQIEEHGESALERALEGIDVGDVKLAKKHIQGHAAREIVEESKRDFDLIVMGSHGHGPFTGAIIGSVTQKVLAHAKCPVLVVKS